MSYKRGKFHLSISKSNFGKDTKKIIDGNIETAVKSHKKNSYVILDQGLPLIANQITVDFKGKNLPDKCIVTFGEDKEKFGLSSRQHVINSQKTVINLGRNGVGGRFIKLDFPSKKSFNIAEISIENEQRKVYGYSQEKGLKQARSVHIGFRHPPTDAFYIEAKPVKSVDGTYFCNIGFNGGYFGVQQLPGGMKISIFSIWDGRSNDPNFTAKDKQARAVYTHPGTRVSRFGGEGSGIKSMMRYNWKLNEYSSYLVTVSPSDDPKRSYYSAFLKDDTTGEWIRMATFNAIGAPQLRGAYSFVEDFKRNYKATTKNVRPLTVTVGTTMPKTKSG